ncbi:AI-2E family transporter [Alphaproteobacteria bacterium GH1-50]|uniref:AI-2E family transporter n=1 Tax=Kangsaoukella pontilimi TaxID=2691042 RepID=A0A7C9IT00_9RHOB|nr:AI-2E family transporter [Kangsaoukella pontilimi]MXQ08465.1 AI-2E family transporter [Kangsaoukella pontilimi]
MEGDKALRRATIGIFLILFVHMLIVANQFLIPVVAAVLAYLALRPAQKWLARRGISGGVFGAVVIVTVACSLLLGATWLSKPVAESVRLLPSAIRDAQSALRDGPPGIFSELTEAAKEAQEAVEEGSGEDPEEEQTVKVKVVEDDKTVQQLALLGPTLLAQVVLSLALLFFLLSSGDLFTRKIIDSFDRFEDKKRSLKLLTDAQDDLGNYLGGITLINFCLGVVIAIGMYLWGIPQYMVIGFLGFALNFIPYLGAILGTAIAGLHGYGAFGDIWPALGVAATYYGASAIEGQFVTPYVIANRLRLNAPVVFVAVAFFAWVWSFIGMIVAIPILIVVKRLLDANASTANIGRFLEGETVEERVTPPAPSED